LVFGVRVDGGSLFSPIFSRFYACMRCFFIYFADGCLSDFSSRSRLNEGQGVWNEWIVGICEGLFVEEEIVFCERSGLAKAGTLEG